MRAVADVPALPHEPNSFVGRESELDELRELVRETGVLTLCGAGGIGKTRLALRILAAVADQFPDGVWFVELADLRQADLVVSRIAATVGVTEEPGRSLLDTLADALRYRRMLLALDNCEHLIDMCALVCQRLLSNSPGLRMLATSREPLHEAAETVWQVPPLSVAPESVRLFVDRAAASAPGFAIGPGNEEAITALCRDLDGIPLAIELAAARVRALSVQQIRDRLADRFGLLTTGHRTAPERQRTLRAAIEWSHDLLTWQEQVLLRRLSVFAGWSLDMAEAVCADQKITAPDVLDLLAALVDKSLVVREPEEALGQARYRMLDTIRSYATTQLEEAGEAEEFYRRFTAFTVSECERMLAVGMAQAPGTWADRITTFRRFDVEAKNTAQVLDWCVAQDDAKSGLRVCSAMRAPWLVRGMYSEGSGWLDTFLAMPSASSAPTLVRGAALTGSAQLVLACDPAAAEPAAEEGLKLCRETGDAFWIGSALNVLGEIYMHTGRLDEASAHVSEALSVALSGGDAWNEGYARGTSAAIAALRGNLRSAATLAAASLAAMERIDQQWGVARTLLGLGDLARLRNDPDDASRHYMRALPVLRELEARPEMARCLAGLGRVAMDLGSYDLARTHLSESLKFSHLTGARIGVARGLAAMAGLELASGRADVAVRLIAAAAALRAEAGMSPLAGAQTQPFLSVPGSSALWTEGLAMGSAAAVELALDPASGMAAPVSAAAPAIPGGLTAREREIVALIASGRSNKAIAAELFISPATAARHVANILVKLGFTSRAQVAVWATDRDLNTVRPPRRNGLT
ncbi:MAG TPA: LuxR C-terminal-related transcriptional regulator [Streptosporangiaceae bacterium]